MAVVENGAGALAAQAQLLERLSNPRTLDALNRLLDRLDVVAFAVEAVDGVIRRGDVIADSLGDSLGDLRKLAAESGDVGAMVGKIPQLARAGSQLADVSATPAFTRLVESGLLEQLGDPRTISALQLLLSKVELAAFLMQMIDGFLQRGDAIADSLAAMVGELRKASESGDEGLRALWTTSQAFFNTLTEMARRGELEKLPQLAETFLQLANSGIFDEKTVKILVEVGQQASGSYLETRASQPPPLGPIALFKALQDPDVQRAMGFVIAMTRNYGKRIQ